MTPFEIFNAVAMIILGISGIIGNVFIIGAILLEKQLKSQGTVFIINLAIVDLSVSIAGFPVFAANIISDQIVPNSICFASGLIISLSCQVSIVNVAAIAFERYVKVCKTTWHQRVFSGYTLVILFVLVWMIPAANTIPILTNGETRFLYDSRWKYCAAVIEELHLWNMVSMALEIFLSILICLVCYIKILQTVRLSRRRVGVHDVKQSQVVSKRDISLYKTMSIIFVCYIIFSAPGIILASLAKCNIHIPFELLQWSIYLLYCNSVVNGFIYGITNRQFRMGYMKFIWFLLCRNMSDSENVTTS